MTAPTVSSIPSLHAFDSHTITWQSYRDKIGFYFQANRITTDGDKKALFLWSVGDRTYQLLESLVSPRLLTNVDTTYNELIKLLDTHYDLSKNIMTSTFDFYSCHQKAGQSFIEWKAELCEKLRYCGFTSSVLANKPQERALRDMYVMGIKSQKIRQALLKEQDPDLETTEKIIQRAERLEEDVRHFNNSVNKNDFTVAKIHNNQHKRQQPQRQRNNQPSNNDSKPCDGCGGTNHSRTSCKYREFICNCCKKKGHLERVCRQRKQAVSTNYISTIYKLDNTNSNVKSDLHSLTVPLHVNGYDHLFQLDTGTWNTIISMNDWYKLGSPAIYSSKWKLQCYSGSIIKTKGECLVTVEYDKQTFQLPVLVANESSSSLVGLQWIYHMKLDLNRVLYGTSNQKSIVHKIHSCSNLQTILDKYNNVLNSELGHCNKVKAHIQLKPDAIPKFFKPRSLPFAYIDGIKTEIERNVNAGIIERIDTSAWAAPIVPVKKPNGKIRICGDFKVTVNPQIWVDQHPIPSIDELFTRLNNGIKFSKLDLSDAYLQIELDEESKQLVVINTPLGLFRYNRLPFGSASAPAIFQRVIDQVISGIPNTVAYLDDIFITGKTEDEHLRTLEMVLSKLADFGFTCNPDKCMFLQDNVSYLGFIIDKHGKRPDSKRIEAIIKMPAPTNVKELEAFIGKVNYYGGFISNFSTKCQVLNRLRQTNVSWNWDHDCQQAFNNLLQEIANATTLVHFDPNLPLILATDASQYGIGAVLMHKYADGIERPIAHASKTLTSTERNYSQVEKEAFSIIFGVKKFHQYLAGRIFELNTDNRPLLTIFNPTKPLPVATANRLQRWAMFLMTYTYNIHFKPTYAHANADALSRLPIEDDNSFSDDDSIQINYIQTELTEQWPLDATEIAAATSTDQTLRLVHQFTRTQWPNTKLKSPDLIPYFNNRYTLSVINGCLLRDTQVIIPQCLQRRVLKMLHRNHMGSVKMKQLARSYCWWPKIDKDINEIAQSCNICSSLQSMPKKEYKSWEEPERVWSRIHLDFAGPFWGSKWLILIDAKSKFPIVIDMGNNTTAGNLTQVLEQIIDWFGPPESLVSDNGPPFNSYEMVQFYKKYGINHITTAPYHPASNGLAERFVRSFKEAMVKQQHMGQTNKHIALRNMLRTYRWTPHTSTGICPANMMLKHSIRTEFDLIKPNKPLKPPEQAKFTVGQLVWQLKYQLNKKPQWQSGIITKQISSMLYEVQSSDGQRYKRHQNQLRHRVSSNINSSETDSLPGDLLETTSKSATVITPTTQSSVSKSPRYPNRNRRPPDRYTPPR
jgi:transposase InsO family protein